MSFADGPEQKKSLSWRWFVIGAVMVALVGTVAVISSALISGKLTGIPSLAGTPAPTEPVEGAALNVTQEAKGLWEALVMVPYGGTDAPASRNFAPITIHETFGVTGQVCVVNNGSQPTEGLYMRGDLQYAEPSGLYQDMTGIRFEYYAEEQLKPAEGRCYLYRMEFLPVAGAVYRIRTQVTVQNAVGWLPGGKNCPGEERCPTGPRVDTDFALPPEPSARTDITATPFFPTATITVTPTLTVGPTYTQVPTYTPDSHPDPDPDAQHHPDRDQYLPAHLYSHSPAPGDIHGGPIQDPHRDHPGDLHPYHDGDLRFRGHAIRHHDIDRHRDPHAQGRMSQRTGR